MAEVKGDRLLVVDGVQKNYAASAEAVPMPVLRGASLTLDAGERLAIIGPSGSGKSTLLNILGALERPDGGTVRLAGKNLAELDEAQLAAVRAREIGFVFQSHHLLPQCTVLENVLVPTLAGGPEQRREKPDARARRLLQRVGLSERLNHRPGQLSGGERQRAAVVRALINEPHLLLADEPTGSLDRASAENLSTLLVELNSEEGVALIVVTHSPQLAAEMSRVLLLRDGILVPSDPDAGRAEL